MFAQLLSLPTHLTAAISVISEGQTTVRLVQIEVLIHLNITALHSSECFSVLYSSESTLHMSVCLLFLTYEVRDLAASFQLLPPFFS